MIEKLALPEIRELLDAGDLATLGGVLNGWLPADLASVLSALKDPENVRLLHALDGPLASKVFGYLKLDAQERLLAILSEPESAGILEGMAPDDRTALLQDLPSAQADRLIGLLSPCRAAPSPSRS